MSRKTQQNGTHRDGRLGHRAGKLLRPGPTPAIACFCKQSFIGTQPRSFVCEMKTVVIVWGC